MNPPFLRRCSALLGLFLLLSAARGEDLPAMRPALIGNQKRSLVNIVDTQSLMKRGQGDAVVLFSCGVSSTGRAYGMQVYRGTPGSKLFQKELLDRIGQTLFEPAVYHHVRVGVWVDATAAFFVVKGKPHLRIYLNQEDDALKPGNDFIAPQLAFANNPLYRAFRYPQRAPGHSGVGSVQISVDINGQIKLITLTYEYPPAMGFGAETVKGFATATFLPGFRNGKQVACKFTTSVVYRGPGTQSKSG